MRIPGAVWLRGFFALKNGRRGKAGCGQGGYTFSAPPTARLSPAEGGDGREGAPERALFPEEGNLWVKNGRNANEEIGKRDFDLLKKDQNSVRT